MSGLRHLPRGNRRLRDVDILADPYAERTAEQFSKLLTAGSPAFVARIGGSDYAAVKTHFEDSRAFEDRPTYTTVLERIQEYNGYFDFDHSRDSFYAFLERMHAYYRRADALLYAGPDLIPQFAAGSFPRRDIGFLRSICCGKTLINYTFVEAVRPSLESFRTWGQGKRILIVSPFSRSIQFQYRRLNELLADYEFPDFELLTYTSPVTYSLPDDTPETLGVRTRNWHEEGTRMAHAIRELEFDVAFLSCASYSMLLGDFIRHELGRSAVYTGGIINVLFNIYGERFDTPYFNAIGRPETRIDAFENEDVGGLRAGRERSNEALRAYFGQRNT